MSLPVRSHIHQNKGFASLEEEVFIGICLVSQMLERPWNRYLMATESISTGQYNMLRILRGAGREGLTVGEISIRMVNRDPNVGAMVHKLIEKRMVMRQRTSSDRSLANIGITVKGLEVLERLGAAASKMPHQLLGHMKDERLKELDLLLGSILKGELEFP